MSIVQPRRYQKWYGWKFVGKHHIAPDHRTLCGKSILMGAWGALSYWDREGLDLCASCAKASGLIIEEDKE